MPAQAATDVKRRLLLSRIEADNLQERDLKCPECGFRIQTLFSDISGHIRVKCPKCKEVNVLNLAYFRTVRSGDKCRRFVIKK